MENSPTEKEALNSILRKVQAAPAAEGPAAEAFEEVTGPAEAGEIESRRFRGELLKGVHLKVRAELGRAHLPLKEALLLRPGSVVDLEKLADDPVDIYVSDLLIARGEVLVAGGSFCVRITEVFSGGEDEK